MKITTVIADGEDEEIRIVCKERNDRIIFIEDILKNAVGHNDTLLLTSSDMQYFIASKELLFCESLDGKIACHTKDGIFYSSYKLYELEKILPYYFCRASKSSLINTKLVYSIKKNISGASEISFKSSAKKAYLSRSYYKPFMEKMNETRL